MDKAIDRALDYLAKHQESDGSFYSSAMRRSTAITSLAIMAFLAKGHTPGQAPYGDILNRGIDFVIAAQQWNGMLVGDTHTHGPMYSHTIATLMLSEVSGMVALPAGIQEEAGDTFCPHCRRDPVRGST